MNYEEAIEWLRGTRSMVNVVEQYPMETWQVRTAQADAAMMEQAYWVAKAHSEGLVHNVEVTGSPQASPRGLPG